MYMYTYIGVSGILELILHLPKLVIWVPREVFPRSPTIHTLAPQCDISQQLLDSLLLLSSLLYCFGGYSRGGYSRLVS